MNMDEYFVLFREYMLVQKPSSVNTRDSYLRDVSAFKIIAKLPLCRAQ